MSIRDTEIIFRDLSDALSELQQKRNSPVDVRRAFGRFITLTHQITETMRKEYAQLTGQEWSASKFDKWDNITALFKKLRRTDYHEFPVVINVRESQHYLAEVLQDEQGKEYNGYIIATVTWGIGDPFSDKIPSKMRLIGYDENMQPVPDMEPEKIEYEFVLHPRTDEIKNALDSAGTDDVHILSELCYETIKEYYNFYNNCVLKHRRNKES